MEEALDGDYQNYKAKGGAYVREHFFGTVSRAARDGRGHDRRRHLAPESRRPRSPEGLRRLRGGHRSTRGPAHGDPREDREGLRPRQGGGERQHRPPAEEARARVPACRSFATATASRSPTRQARGPALLQAARGQRGDAVPARAARGPRRIPARPAATPGRAAVDPGLRDLREPDRGHGRRARSPPPWPSCACSRRSPATRTIWRARRSDRARRGPHLRHGGAVPHTRHLRREGAALRSRRCRPGHVLQGGFEGADPAGGDHRGRRPCRPGSPPPPPTRPTACR